MRSSSLFFWPGHCLLHLLLQFIPISRKHDAVLKSLVFADCQCGGSIVYDFYEGTGSEEEGFTGSRS